ncbi:MAG: elongation factor P [Candidatus Omnitrophota bacterium]
MIITINQIETGIGLLINDEVYLVTEYHHVKPGKGAAFVRVKLKSIKTDLSLERTFRTADKLESVDLEENVMQFLYHSGDSYHFMDQQTYEETVISREQMGENVVAFLQDNLQVTMICNGQHILKVVLPTFIVANIIETEPGFKGDSSRAGTKPATIDTGTNVQIPLFVNKGDWIKIDTRTGQYVERVQK